MRPNRLTHSVKVALGWDGSSSLYDLDMMALAIGKDGMVQSIDQTVFYNHLEAFDGAMLLSSDSQTGAGIGDNEEIYIQLNLLPDRVEQIDITVTLYKADGRTFGDVPAAFLRIMYDEIKEELVRFELSDDFKNEHSVKIGEIRRAEGGGWRIALDGKPLPSTCREIAGLYGLSAYPDSLFKKRPRYSMMSPLHNKKPFL